MGRRRGRDGGERRGCVRLEGLEIGIAMAFGGISWLDLILGQIGGGSNSSMGCDLRARVVVGGFGVMWCMMSPMCLGLSLDCDDSHTQPCLAT